MAKNVIKAEVLSSAEAKKYIKELPRDQATGKVLWDGKNRNKVVFAENEKGIIVDVPIWLYMAKERELKLVDPPKPKAEGPEK